MNSVYKDDTGRLTARITLKAYAFETYGEIDTANSNLRVSLIDITPTGARLKLLTAEPHTPLVGDTFLLNIELPLTGVESGSIPCRAAWVEKNEIGVAFVQGLQSTVRELQDSIDSSARRQSL